MAEDIDFDAGTIPVEQQVQRAGGEMRIEPVKTRAGQASRAEPQRNFVTAMNDALNRADRVVALSPAAYFERERYTTQEWSSSVVVGAENLCHLAGCSTDRWLLGPAPAGAWDDFRLAGLKLIFLIVTRAVSLLGLSRREWCGRTPRSLCCAISSLWLSASGLALIRVWLGRTGRGWRCLQGRCRRSPWRRCG